MCTCIFYSHCLCSQTTCTCRCWCMNNCSENVVWQLNHTCESALQIWRNWKVQWALGCSWLYFNQLLWIFCAIKIIVSIILNFFVHVSWWRSIFTNFGLSLVDSFSKDVTNGAISNGCAHHENSAKKKDACNGKLHNGTVSNGDVKKSDTHLRQRNRDTSSESSTPNGTVQETGRKNMCYECRCRAGLFLDKTQDRR